MNKATRYLIRDLLVHRIIGEKHTPEDRAKKFIKWLNKKEKKEFEKEYKLLINLEILLRRKKQTGKGTDWHISLNPRKIQEVGMILK